MPHEFEHAPEPAPIGNGRPADKAVKDAEIWGTIVDCLALGFLVVVGFLVSLCILRVAYSAYLAVLRWHALRHCDSSSDDEDYEIAVREPVPHRQQQAKWISHTGIQIVIHPGEIASLAIPTDSKPVLHGHFCTDSPHRQKDDQIHSHQRT
ncbi:hypothetical protein BSKO_01008 [Bryopsis sp. KO-2023]|nr:hypothetical protein BSKO_01008 [Bryopsis sp. KO-2023]